MHIKLKNLSKKNRSKKVDDNLPELLIGNIKVRNKIKDEQKNIYIVSFDN